MNEGWSHESDLMARLEWLELEARRLSRMRERTSAGDLREVVESDLSRIDERIALIRRRLKRPSVARHPIADKRRP
jgi:hypothetical protein